MNLRSLSVFTLISGLILGGLWSAPAGAADGATTGEVIARNTLSQPTALSDEETVDLDWFRKNTVSGVPYQLDLADPRQYRHLLELLGRGGADEKKSPHLFALLKTANTASRRKGARTEPKVTLRADGTPEVLNYISAFEATGERSFQATGLSSVNKGTQSTNIVLVLYGFDAANKPKVYTANSESTYTEGAFFQVGAKGTLPADLSNPTTLVEAAFTYVPNDSTTGDPVVVYYRADATINPTDGCMVKPNYCVRDSSNNCNGGQYQTTCTNKVSSTTPIKVCYYRGSQQECDYFNKAPAHPTDFVFPLSGNVQFDRSIFGDGSGKPYGATTITLENPNKGGGCYLTFQQASPLNTANWRLSTTKIANDTLSWSFDAAAFPDPNKCLNYTDATNTYLRVQVNSLVMADATFGAFTFTSQRQTPVSGVYIVPQIQIQQGCFAAGTAILMENGREESIERIAIGDQVRTATGQSRKVLDVTSGIEPKPMIRFTLADGRSLLVTETHPLATEDGLRQALAIREGVRLRTADGVVPVTRISNETYKDKVYSLRIGSAEDAKAGTSTLIANGIVAGDTLTQEWLEKKATAVVSDASDVLSRVHPDWRQDYLNQQR